MSNNFYDIKSRDYFGAVKHGVIATLGTAHMGRVLDIGGGDGATVRFLIEDGRATGAVVMDPYAQAKSIENLEVRTDSADNLDNFDKMVRQKECFDTVLCLDVLEHLVNPWAVVEKLKSIHQPGGKLIVCMPNARFVGLTIPLVLFGRFDYKPSGIMDKTHIRWFTRATTIEMIEQAGYRIEQVDGLLEPRVVWANRLTLGLFRRFFDYQYVVQAVRP